MAPKLYGWQHLTYLAIFAVVLVGLILVAHFCCKTEKAKTILIKSVAGVLLILILLNRYCFPIGMGCYTLYGLFVIDVFKWNDAMCINSSILKGAPLNWWVITIAGTALLAGVLGLIELIKKRKCSKAEKQLSQDNSASQ